MWVLLSAAAPISHDPITGPARITDGDTLRIGNERIRLAARKLVEERRRRGKKIASPGRHKLTVQLLLRTYREDTQRKQSLVRKAESTRDRLAFVTAALRTLLDDAAFLTLIHAERLDSLPKNIAARISRLGENSNVKDQSAC